MKTPTISYHPPCQDCLYAKLGAKSEHKLKLSALFAVNGLTPRQKEVLIGLAGSKTVKELALNWGRTTKTVEHHRKELYKAVGIFDLAGITRLAMQAGLLCLVLLAGCATPPPVQGSKFKVQGSTVPSPLPSLQAAAPRPALRTVTPAPALVTPPVKRYLVWSNPPQIRTNLAAYTNWYCTVVQGTTNFHAWQTATNLPLTQTNYGPIPAGRFWRVGYAPK